MSKIDELVQAYCPDGVKYHTLDEMCVIKVGGDTPAKYHKGQKAPSDEYPYPIYSNGTETYGYSNSWKIDKEAVTISSIGNVGWVAFREAFFTPIIRLKVLIPKDTTKLDTKYLFYITSVQSIIGTNSSLSSINANDVKRLKIPIPPLEVQKEIVNILDKFTQLEAELSAELDARRKQYEYYRSQLLTFDDESEDVRWLTLEDVCTTISAGGDLPKNYKKGQAEPSGEYPYPIYSNGSDDKALYGYTDGYKIDKEAVTISARGTIGFHAIRQPNFTPIVRLITLIPNHSILTPKYLNYALDITEIGHSGGSIPQLTVPNVKKIKIPIPSIAEQDRITSLLDKFDTLSNSISEGLPAEINARRKQYEYYRTKLLTFQELPA